MGLFRKETSIATYIPWALYLLAWILTMYWTIEGGYFLENYITAVVIFNGGVQGLWGACGHLILPKQTAKSIGWESGGFQTEVGGINLAIGVTGILCYFFYTWAMPVGLIISIYYLVCVYGHLKDRFFNNNKAPCNSGPMLYNTIVVSISLIFAIIAIAATGQISDFINVF